jgi:two-component system, NarL family, invasion response regulator UvrY
VIRIFLADDHGVVREGVRRLLEEQSGFAVVGDAATVAEMLAELRRTPVDVVLLDIGMPGPGIVQTLHEIKTVQPQARALVLTAYPEADYAVRAIRAGAVGYLTKDRSMDQLFEAIRRVHRGGMYVSPSLGEALAARLGGGQRGPAHEELSDREFQVLRGLAEGEPLKAIARRLEVSPKTVTTYRTRIFQKLSLRTNAELVRYAIEHRLLSHSHN